MQLADLKTRIRIEASDDGQSLAEDQIASYLMGKFEDALKAAESSVYAEFQTNEGEVKQATKFFEGEEDADVVNAIAKLRELYRSVTGGDVSDGEIPADLTLDKVPKA